MKLNVKATALSFGILWGGGMFLFVIWSTFSSYPNSGGIITFLSHYYLGLESTFLGSIIGFFWGFCDAAFGGALFAWLYNKFCN